MPAALMSALLGVAARVLGGLTSEQFGLVLRWIELEAHQHPERDGLQKAARVIERLKALVGNRDGHVLRTVVQMAYTIARIKGILPL